MTHFYIILRINQINKLKFFITVDEIIGRLLFANVLLLDKGEISLDFISKAYVVTIFVTSQIKTNEFMRFLVLGLLIDRKIHVTFHRSWLACKTVKSNMQLRHVCFF